MIITTISRAATHPINSKPGMRNGFVVFCGVGVGVGVDIGV